MKNQSHKSFNDRSINLTEKCYFFCFRQADLERKIFVEVAADDGSRAGGKFKKTEKILESDALFGCKHREGNDVTRATNPGQVTKLGNLTPEIRVPASLASSKMTYEKFGLPETEEREVDTSHGEKVPGKNNSVILERNHSRYGSEIQDVVQLNSSFSSNKNDSGKFISSNPFADGNASSCNPFLSNSNPFLTNDRLNNPFSTMSNNLYRSNCASKNPFLQNQTNSSEPEKNWKSVERDVQGDDRMSFGMSSVSPLVSPGSSPRPSRSRMFKESRRISIDKTGHHLHLNQYRLLDCIGEVSCGVFFYLTDR